ncbi:MAG: cyclic nucleotide-binding domain-containing protein [Nitrospirae bacterium]|nr:cyclic nucleotide-binding domain-containing protein [Nitrospirota bacterium]
MNFLSLFNDLLRRKLDKAKELHFSQGQTIVKFGEESDSVYVVKAGLVKVYPQGVSPQDDSGVSVIGSGGIFGDFDFFNKKPRTATVIATGDTTLYELDRPLVSEIVKEYPEVLDFFKKTYQSGINNLIKEADAIKAYYENDLVFDHD